MGALDVTVAGLKARICVDQNPYLRALADGSLSREDFLETQVQFLFAVVFFSRPMAALAARLPRAQLRVALLENIHDEHGHGDVERSHERTFLELLARLGVRPAEIECRALWPEVRAFNSVLWSVCVLDDTFTALAVLAIIEDLFAGISARIGSGIVGRGWLPAGQVVHYAIHEALDVAHAEGFYRGLRAPYDEDPRARDQIDQGLQLGAYAFMRMYEDLWHQRARRWTRTVRGPHSLADGWSLDETDETT